jgi:hypothetical protein
MKYPVLCLFNEERDLKFKEPPFSCISQMGKFNEADRERLAHFRPCKKNTFSGIEKHMLTNKELDSHIMLALGAQTCNSLTNPSVRNPN